MDSLSESHLFQRLLPTPSSRRLRNDVLELLRWNLEKCLSPHRPLVACYGSFPLQTYLPCGDLDVTIILSGGPGQESDVLKTVRAQMEFLAKIRPQYAVRGIAEVKAEVRVLKVTLCGVPVDISVNQIGGLHTWRLLESVNSRTDNHFFKRALVLVKAWATYEARIAGSQCGLLASYALAVLVLFTLNVSPAARVSPLASLREMLRILSDFDWDRTVVTAFGPVAVEDYLAGKGPAPLRDGGVFSEKDLARLKPTGQQAAFVRKYINLADPLRADNNLGRSVGRGTFERVRLAFLAGNGRKAGLFPTLQGRDTGSGRSSPSTGSEEDEEDRFGFTTALDEAETVLLKAGETLAGTASRSGKPWMSRPLPRVTVGER